MQDQILEVKVDILNRPDSLSKIVSWIRQKDLKRTKLVITAYSEFFVTAQTDVEFLNVMNEADLVTPDGVSVLAASSYLRSAKNRSWFGT